MTEAAELKSRDDVAMLLRAAQEMVFSDKAVPELCAVVRKAHAILAAEVAEPSEHDCAYRLDAERLRARVVSLEGEVESLKGTVEILHRKRIADRKRITDILDMPTEAIRIHLVVLRDSMPKDAE